LRLPPGWDAVEPVVRKRAGAALTRGTVYANLSLKRVSAAAAIRLNEDVLTAVLKAATDIAARLAAPPPTVDAVLAVKGVLDVAEAEEDEEQRRAAESAVVAAFDAALAELDVMRHHEGAALAAILSARLDELAALAARADATPGRKAEAIKARLAAQVAALIDASERFDPDRLHQEALMLATKADIREELDRIAAHVTQAREMIAKGGPVGRRLDFLAQELNREVNTCCSKANDLELTNLGLEMKNVVEQFREQVQNLE
jgi:uncharacterized protein (TIGR00255 family)